MQQLHSKLTLPRIKKRNSSLNTVHPVESRINNQTTKPRSPPTTNAAPKHTYADVNVSESSHTATAQVDLSPLMASIRHPVDWD